MNIRVKRKGEVRSSEPACTELDEYHFVLK